MHLESHARSSLFVGLGLAMLAATTSAQPRLRDAGVAARAFGVSRVADGLLGGGPGYHVAHDDRGLAFTAVAGAESARVGLALASFGRGVGTGQPVAPARPETDGVTVRYARSTFVETHRLSAAGVEVSYTFDALPPGAGDLFVRLRVDTDLSPSASDRDVDRVTLRRGERDVIAIGAVTGIDASGARVAGVMRWHNGNLELRLPAAFVDRAALPLVLDPLISSRLTFASTGGGSPSTNVSYDATHDVFLTTWSSGSVPRAQMYAQRVRPDGTLVGPLITFGVGAHGATANVDARNCFVLTYLDDATSSHHAVTVDAGTGAVSAPLVVPALGDLGGEVGPFSRVLHVWSQTNAIMAASLSVDASLNLSASPAVQVGQGFAPVVAKHGGPSGRYLMAWSAPAGFDGVIVDRDLQVLDQGQLVASSSPTRINPCVDGNGDEWLFAYRVGGDTRCRPVFWDSNAAIGYLGDEKVVAAYSPAGRVVNDPYDVVRVGASYLVVFESWSGLGGGQTYLQPVDPYTAGPCEARAATAFTSVTHMAAQKTGDPAGGDVVLMTDLFWGQLYRVDDGLHEDLGGGCARGGYAAASCARAGNSEFSLRLRDARVGVPAALVLGTQTSPLPCGACSLIPTPSVVVATVTDSRGNAAVAAPLPAGLVGAAFYQQWLTVGGTACGLGVEMSNALRVQLQ